MEKKKSQQMKVMHREPRKVTVKKCSSALTDLHFVSHDRKHKICNKYVNPYLYDYSVHQYGIVTQNKTLRL